MTSSVAVTSTKNASLRSAASSQDGLYAPGSMAVPKASTAAAAVGWAASARGSSPRDRLAASGPSRSGRFVSPAITPTSLVANQVPPPTSSRPPDGRSAYSVKPGHRDRRAGEALVTVGRHDQRHPWDDAADHDQEAHRGQRRSRWSDGWVLAAEPATSTSSPATFNAVVRETNITDD